MNSLAYNLFERESQSLRWRNLHFQNTKTIHLPTSFLNVVLYKLLSQCFVIKLIIPYKTWNCFSYKRQIIFFFQSKEWNKYSTIILNDSVSKEKDEDMDNHEFGQNTW